MSLSPASSLPDMGDARPAAARPGTPPRPPARPPARPAPPAPAVPSAFQQFVSGFVTPSVPAFWAMVASFAATLALVAWLFSEAALAGRAGTFVARSGTDAHAFVTHEALALARTPAIRPRLVLIGTSSTAQMAATGEELARQLSMRAGERWDVHVLATPQQSPSDQVALVQNALRSARRGSPPIIIAIGFQVQRMGWMADRLADPDYRDRLGLRSGWADAELRRLGLTPRLQTGLHALDVAPFTMEKALVALARFGLQAPARRQADVFAEMDPAPGALQRRRIIAAQIADGLGAGDDWLALMGRLADHVAATPEARLVFFEETMKPGFAAEAGITPLVAHQQARFSAFAAERGIPYWRVTRDADLTDADFHDDLHIRRGAPQSRARAELARRVAEHHQ